MIKGCLYFTDRLVYLFFLSLPSRDPRCDFFLCYPISFLHFFFLVLPPYSTTINRRRLGVIREQTHLPPPHYDTRIRFQF